MARYKAIQQIDTSEVRVGKHLELAEAIDNEQLVKLYIDEHNIESKKFGGKTYVWSVYQSDSFHYFLRMINDNPRSFYKVNKQTIDKVNWRNLSRDTIGRRFHDEIIVKANQGNAESYHRGHYYIKYDYTPLAYSTKIILTREMNVLTNSDFGIRKRRVFQASYDIETGEMKKLYEGKEAKY